MTATEALLRQISAALAIGALLIMVAVAAVWWRREGAAKWKALRGRAPKWKASPLWKWLTESDDDDECEHCGYALAGLAYDCICPECGWKRHGRNDARWVARGLITELDRQESRAADGIEHDDLGEIMRRENHDESA